MNVVIADDSRAMRMIVRKTIRDAGYGYATVREASDGQEALDLIREWNPDLLMTDWNMPNMSGLELLQALKEDGFRGTSGVVSSSASPEMRTEAMGAGAQFVVQKPFTPRSFQDAIRIAGFEPENKIAQELADATEFALHLEGVRASLAAAYKRPLAISAVPSMNLRGVKTCALATYEEDGTVTALVVMEIPLAAALAAALSLIPAHVAKPAAEAGEFSDELKGNLSEVFNLFSRILGTEERAAHLSKVEIGVDIPIFARAFVRKGRRCDAKIAVQGYGEGRVCLAATT